VYLLTLEFWLWTALVVVSAGLVLRVFAPSAFLNFLGWLMLTVALAGFLAAPVWVAHVYGFGVLIATLGTVLLIILAGGLWLLLWVRRLTECVG
jgi:hypothetical protein